MTFYTPVQRQWQDRFETRPLADAVAQAAVSDELRDEQAAFIGSRDFFFLSTVNAAGEPTVSYKGGEPGTVRVLDSRTLVFPAYDGNGMFLSLGNIDESARIGLLFIDFETPNRLRVQATARAQTEGPLLESYPGAIAVVQADIDKVFVNCARYVHKHERIAPSPYVPDANGAQPFATWKRIDAIQPVLPPRDQGRADAEGGCITEQEYAQALQRGES